MGLWFGAVTRSLRPCNSQQDPSIPGEAGRAAVPDREQNGDGLPRQGRVDLDPGCRCVTATNRHGGNDLRVMRVDAPPEREAIAVWVTGATGVEDDHLSGLCLADRLPADANDGRVVCSLE